MAVEYSTVNYKDGLCMTSGGGMVRAYPHVPGIDFAGTVEASDDPRYRPGDKVVLTGWRVGETHWGGYAQKARVKADWLVPLPQGLTTRAAMAVGTAGLTAMLAVMALEAHGLQPGQGPVLVTGAAGGVGSVAVSILAQLGYQVAAVTGRPETEAYLRALGATQIVPRDQINETVKRPLEAEAWSACIDAVGGAMLARVLGPVELRRVGRRCRPCGRLEPARHASSRSCCAASTFWASIPCCNPLPTAKPHGRALPPICRWTSSNSMVTTASLADLPRLGAAILAGQVQGPLRD